jgi:diketogulonate reductase-like aldo/keto reductase
VNRTPGPWFRKRCRHRTIPPRRAIGGVEPGAKPCVAGALKALAADKGVTLAQLSLAWILARGDDIVPIPGTDQRRYLEENARAAEVQLTPDDLRRITEAFPPEAVAGERLADDSRIDR